MTSPRLVTVLAASVATAAALSLAHVAGAADDPPAKPTAEIHDVMLAMNDDGNEGAVLQQLKAAFKKPLDEDGWKAAKAKAAMMVEGGNLLLGKKPPRGAETPEGLADWKRRALAYRDGAEAIRAAAAKKDAAAGSAAVVAVGKQCTECHKAHQPPEHDHD